MEHNNIGFKPITLDIRPWKVLTPPTPKHTNLEAMSSCFRSLYVIKEFMIKKIKLSTLDPNNTCYTWVYAL
jgi:hypothetical protein